MITRFELPEAFDRDDRAHFESGIAAFRSGDWYLAHDEWEEVWQGYRGADRRFLQGLIHVAVGAYHAECANPKGACSQIGKAREKLTPYLPSHWGIDIAALLLKATDVSSLMAGSDGAPDAISERTRAI